MEVSISLPSWARDAARQLPPLPLLDDRMRTVISFARRNFEHDTGGPFAAGVFEQDTGRLVAMGVNRVIPTSCSSAHAEVVALSLAQQSLGVYDLGGTEMPHHQLVVNWRPCVMCYGAVIWSGVRSLVIAGSDHQLEQITGFDEGPLHPDWKDELQRRGIDVIDDLLRDEACDVFRAFARAVGSSTTADRDRPSRLDRLMASSLDGPRVTCGGLPSPGSSPRRC